MQTIMMSSIGNQHSLSNASLRKVAICPVIGLAESLSQKSVKRSPNLAPKCVILKWSFLYESCPQLFAHVFFAESGFYIFSQREETEIMAQIILEILVYLTFNI